MEKCLFYTELGRSTSSQNQAGRSIYSLKLKSWLFLIVLFFSAGAFAQSDSTRNQPDFQIFLKQPAKEIHLIWYEKNFMPVQGKLSEDRKSVIIKNYDRGARVRVKVEYEDGTIDEFVKSPCFIDPVVS